MTDRCSVDGCPGGHYAKGLCNKHYQRARKHGSPDVVLPRREPGPRPEAYVESPTYRTVHSRLTNEQGPASRRDCADCGQQASEWSYDGTDPDPLMEEIKGWPLGRPVPYSTDLSRYVPRCRSCHRRSERGVSVDA